MVDKEIKRSLLNKQNILLLLSIVTLFIYLLMRSIFVPLVFDEAATFFHYIHKGSFIPPYAHWDANNHILNSALSYLNYLLFGSSSLSLRLANVLTFILFFYYTYKISELFNNKLLRWTFLLSLCFAHNFIEFFALSRGYGMSMAFLFGAIYYVIQVLNHNRLRDYFASVIFISLAILANLTLLNTAIMLAVILSINVFLTRTDTYLLARKSNKRFSLKAFTIITFGAFLPTLVLIRLLLEFKKKGLLYYGSLDGFWELSVDSLIKLLTQSENILIPIIILIYFISIIALLVYQLINAKHILSFWKSKYIFVVLFLGNLTAILIMANLLDINYPEDRTGIYFFPLFIGAILFSLDGISENINKRLLVFLLLPFLFFPIHFLYTLNLTHSTLYMEENIPNRFTKRIADDSKEVNEAITIGGYRMRLLTVAYQNFRLGGNLNQIQWSHYPEYLSEYQIVKLNKDEDWLEHYSIEDFDEFSGLSLLKRKEGLRTLELKNIYDVKSEVVTKEYFNIYKGSIDSLQGESLLLKIKMNIYSPEKPIIGWVVAITKDKNNKRISYEYISLDWKKTEWKSEKDNFIASLFMYDINNEAKQLSIYFWNIEKKEVELSNINVSFNQVLKD